MSTIESQIKEVAKRFLSSKDGRTSIKEVAKNELISLGITPKTVVHEIKPLNGKKKNITDVHYKFPVLLNAIRARVPVALVGPAGSFKTSSTAKVAEVLDLPFYSISVSLQTGKHEFFGYTDANGEYRKTLFREAYENGGVFLLDEFDAGNANVLASINQAAANTMCPFPDKMVKKHEDFVLVMAGNTYGHGGTIDYVGRNQIDGATLDRFVFIQFDYDEDLELKLSGNTEWCKKIQNYRKIAMQKKIKTIISPRATFNGAKLLAAGLEEREVLNLTVFKGLNDKEIKILEQK